MNEYINLSLENIDKEEYVKELVDPIYKYGSKFIHIYMEMI
ncbi:MAG: hypothetical protein ACI31S_03560 [Bacilli bacterium]